MAKTSEELKASTLKRGVEKMDARDKKFSTYLDRGTSGRDAGLKEAAGRTNQIARTYATDSDLISRYGKDAPNARSFMAYEGQSGTAKKKGYKNGGCVMAGRGSKYKGQM